MDLLPWFPLATDWLVGLSLKVDQGFRWGKGGGGGWGGAPMHTVLIEMKIPMHSVCDPSVP